MNFPCPKCNTPDKGVLLFNLVAPCDTCSGIVPEKKKEKYTIHKHKELPSLGVYYKVALGCGCEGDRDYINERINSGILDYYFDLFLAKEYIDLYVKNKPEGLCIVQWSE